MTSSSTPPVRTRTTSPARCLRRRSPTTAHQRRRARSRRSRGASSGSPSYASEIPRRGLTRTIRGACSRRTRRPKLDVVARIEAAASRWNVLDHPFYQRWSAGELTREELAEYAAQYRHAVVALADAAAAAGDTEHAQEEREHVALWDDFAAACGSVPADPTSETAE